MRLSGNQAGAQLHLHSCKLHGRQFKSYLKCPKPTGMTEVLFVTQQTCTVSSGSLHIFTFGLTRRYSMLTVGTSLAYATPGAGWPIHDNNTSTKDREDA